MAICRAKNGIKAARFEHGYDVTIEQGTSCLIGEGKICLSGMREEQEFYISKPLFMWDDAGHNIIDCLVGNKVVLFEILSLPYATKGFDIEVMKQQGEKAIRKSADEMSREIIEKGAGSVWRIWRGPIFSFQHETGNSERIQVESFCNVNMIGVE
jgi:hypothetical protein